MYQIPAAFTLGWSADGSTRLRFPFCGAAHNVVWSPPTDGFIVVGEAVSGEESVAGCSELHPDLVLMDVNLPGIDGVEATRAEGSRSIVLSAGRGKPTARLIPLGLPTNDFPTDRGSIAIEGREVIVTVRREGSVFVGKRDSLVTKCPSKFSAAKRS